MAFLRAGDTGLDVTQANIQAYQFLTVSELTSTAVTADFRVIGQPGYVVRFTGTGLGGSVEAGQVTGTLTGLRETLNGSLLFEMTGVAISAQTVLGLIVAGSDGAAASLVLGGDDVVQGGASNDVLRAYRGNNVFGGGGGFDAVLIDAVRPATLSYRYGDQAVVFRRADGQADRLAGVESARFRDGTMAQSALEAARPYQYLATHADVQAAFGNDPAAGWCHFAQFGLIEGRSAGFSGLSYIASYADLRAAFSADGGAATLHWVQFGLAEGRTFVAPA